MQYIVHRALIAMVAGASIVGCSTARSEPEFLVTPEAASRPFSPAVRASGLLFLAGKLGTDSTGKLAPGGIQAETRQAMQNIGAELAKAGSGFDRVLKCTVFLADMGEWAAMNEVYAPFFPEGKRPARTAVAVSGLALDARVEIECIAAA
ncbi:MAG TPA: RidA family protein [Gemmatimonadaceae bacterium]|nr:RidA family protein [Gemmatimonadaceae bacterium]